MYSSDASNRLSVMQDEFNSLFKNKTWVLVKRSKNSKVLGSRWLFKRKEGIKGVELTRYKAK